MQHATPLQRPQRIGWFVSWGWIRLNKSKKNGVILSWCGSVKKGAELIGARSFSTTSARCHSRLWPKAGELWLQPPARPLLVWHLFASMKAVPLNVIETYVAICLVWVSVPRMVQQGHTDKRGFSTGRWSCSLATNGHGSDAGAGPAEEKLKPPAPSRPEVHLGDGWGGALELYLHDSACREVVPSNQSESVIIVWSCIFEGQIADMKPQRVKDCELGKFLWSDTCCCMIWELARIPHAESQNVTNLIGIIIHSVWLSEDLKLETSWIHHRSPRKHQLGEEHYQVAESSHAKFVMAGSSLVADLILLFADLFFAFAPATAAKTHEEMCTRTAGHTWHNNWKFSLLTWIAFHHFDHPDLFDFRQSPLAPSTSDMSDMPMFHCSRLDHSGWTWHCSSWAWEASI